jgi:hypothetical protein
VTCARRQLVADVETVTGGRVVVVAGGLALMVGRNIVATVQRSEDHDGDLRRLGTGWCAYVVGMALSARVGEA